MKGKVKVSALAKPDRGIFELDETEETGLRGKEKPGPEGTGA